MTLKVKQQLLVIFSFILGLAIFLWLGRIIGWEKIGEAFAVFTGWQGLAIIALTFLIVIIGNLRWKEILEDAEVHVPFWDLFRIYLGGYAMMYLLPTLVWGGEAFRMYGLSKEKKIPWQKTFSSVVIERILEWTVNIIVIVLGVLAFIFYKYKTRLPAPEILLIFGLAFAFFVFIITYFYVEALGRKSIIRRILKRFFKKEVGDGHSLVIAENEIFNFFQFNNISFGKGLVLSVLRALAMQLRAWLLIIFLGASIGFWPALSVLSFSYISSLVPIPASLGSHEAMQMFAFTAMALPASMATAFTLIIRAAEIVVSSLGLVFIIRTGFNLVGSKFITYDKDQ
jgi:uncharacterized protein (TIRG00374 family)